MRAYSDDLRQRVIKQWQAGKKLSDLVELFAVSAGSVKRWIKQYRENGDVQAKQRTVWTYRLSPEQYALLRQQVEQHRDATLAEHVVIWADEQHQSISVSTMWRGLRAIGWSLKKRQWEPVSVTRRPALPFERSLPD